MYPKSLSILSLSISPLAPLSFPPLYQLFVHLSGIGNCAVSWYSILSIQLYLQVFTAESCLSDSRPLASGTSSKLDPHQNVILKEVLSSLILSLMF